MKFIIGYAGIPSEIYDEVYKKRTHICIRDPNCEFISQPLRKTNNGLLSYTESHANYFLREFANRLKQDAHNKLVNTGFALIYVEHDAHSTHEFYKSFFPSIFAFPVRFNLDCSSKQATGRSKNTLVELLRTATDDIKNSIPIIKKEITEHDSKTPLLLPVKNFTSNCLKQELQALQTALPRAQNKNVALKDRIQNIEHSHPRLKVGSNNKRCFIDSRDIEFHPPGSARHAFARSTSGHPDTCLLAGKRRLGAPYDHAFHYDCCKGNNNLQGEFWGCHDNPSRQTGRPHLNIAPNDYVR